MYKEDKKLLEEYFLINNSAPRTIKTYNHAVIHYNECHNKSFAELLEEADTEEENGIRLKKRKIKQRLLTYREYMKTKGLAVATINMYIVKIKSLYRYFEIEVPTVPPLKNKAYKTIEDIPSLEDVKLVLNSTNNLRNQAMVLFVLTSGCAKAELVNITIQDFIEATKDYHNSTEISDVIKQLLQQDDVIPLFNIFRKKTNFFYYTCCSPEAVTKICLMLKERLNRKQINNTDLLFDITGSYAMELFREMNDRLGFGFVGNWRYFRIHTLRMRFQTELVKAKMDTHYYQHMLGHSFNSVDSVYIKIDPNVVREEYKRVVDNLCLYSDINYVEITSDDKQELLRLRNEIREIKQELNRRIK